MDAPGSDGSAFHTRTRHRLRSAWLRTAYRAAFQPLRMVVTWAQVTSQIGGVLHIHYPPLFASAVQAVFDLLRGLKNFIGQSVCDYFF